MAHRSTMYRRVRRGIAWLEEHIPGWQSKIDVDRLDMGNGNHNDMICGCVGAQLDAAENNSDEGQFDDFLTSHGLSPADAVRLGLLDLDTGDVDYNELTGIWQRAIVKED